VQCVDIDDVEAADRDAVEQDQAKLLAVP